MMRSDALWVNLVLIGLFFPLATAQGQDKGKDTCIVCGEEPNHPNHGKGEGQHQFRPDCDVRVALSRSAPITGKDAETLESFESWVEKLEDYISKLRAKGAGSPFLAVPMPRAIAPAWRDTDSKERSLARFTSYTTVVWSANLLNKEVWAVGGATSEWALIHFRSRSSPTRTVTKALELDARDLFGGWELIFGETVKWRVRDRGKLFTITRGELEEKIREYAKGKGLFPTTTRHGAEATPERVAEQFIYAKVVRIAGADVLLDTCATDLDQRSALTQNVGESASAVTGFKRFALPRDFEDVD